MTASEYTLFDIPSAPCAPVTGQPGRYPVRRIFCIGRNYAAHAKEMGASGEKKAPIYFTKPPSGLVFSGAEIPYPPGTSDLHHEMEMVVALGGPAFNATPREAGEKIYGYACGLDLTRRDLQAIARKNGGPWDLAKAFENSAAIAAITKATDIGEIGPQRINLSVNGEIRQDARLSDMLWKCDEIIADLSRYYHLGPGDLIYTGTPAGVGPLRPGDRVVGEIDGLAPINITITDPE